MLAVDGTYLQLPKTEELRDEFGTRGEDGYCVSAGVSALYDVISGWPLDPILTHGDMNGRVECEKHNVIVLLRFKSFTVVSSSLPSSQNLGSGALWPLA